MDDRKVPFFSIFRETLLFLFTDMRRLKKLTAVPVIFTGFASLLFVFLPDTPMTFELTKETVAPALLLFVLFLLYVATMVQTHTVIFYRDSEGYFIPAANKEAIKKTVYYAYLFFKTLFAGWILSTLFIILLYLIFSFFFDVSIVKPQYVPTFGILCTPFFVIRFCMIFPASAAGEKKSLYAAWKMTAGNTLSLNIFYMLSFLTPLILGVSAALMMSGTTVMPLFIGFAKNFASNLSLLFACVTQAAFMSYLFLYVRQTESIEMTSDKSILSLAKDKESD